MNYGNYFENAAFTEWYHYAILLFWLVALFIGLRYFHTIESIFKPNDNYSKGKKNSVYLLLGSFVLGICLFFSMAFNSSTQSGLEQSYSIYGLYALFLALLVLNTMIGIRKYKRESLGIRLVIMTALMLIYFYSGMLGGLMVAAALALGIVVYFVIKFKNILSLQ